MLSNYKIPGFLLVSLGGLFLSTGGALFKLFENQDVWTIYFWRSFLECFLGALPEGIF